MRVAILSIVVFLSCIIIIYCAIGFFLFPLKYKSIIRECSDVAGVSPVLVASVIRAESNFKPNAVSRKGAIGLMQILPNTADYVMELQKDEREYDLFNPYHNIRIGTLYLRYLLDKFSDVKTAIIAYNAGEGNVIRWLDGAERLSITPFPETNSYVEKVFNAMNFYRHRV